MIRRLTPTDADAFSAMRLLGLELHPEAFGTGAEAWRKATPAQRGARLEPADKPGDRFVLGAFDEDTLIGLIGFRREGKARVRHKGSLWGLFVHPDHRRRGVGAALLDTALEEARGGEGMRYVRVVVTLANEDAVRLFESSGFTRFGLEAGGLCLDGVDLDQVFMQCRFDQANP